MQIPLSEKSCKNLTSQDQVETVSAKTQEYLSEVFEQYARYNKYLASLHLKNTGKRDLMLYRQGTAKVMTSLHN